jgi:hypothetical protein
MRVLAAVVVLCAMACAKGTDGATGPEGTRGAPGATGPTGATGLMGTTGPTGVTGPGGADGLLRIFGDGSAGSHTVSANEDWTTTPEPAAAENLQFTDFTVNPGVTLKVPSGTIIRCTGNVTINGVIDVGFGAEPGVGPFFPEGFGVTFPGVTPSHPGVALSFAVQGDMGTTQNRMRGGVGGKGLGGLQRRMLTRPGTFGGGAGATSLLTHVLGRRGGGSVVIITQGTLNVGAQGALHANAETWSGAAVPGVGGAGGGGGGVIILASMDSITNAGTLTANGSDGEVSGNNEAPGGGGGGGMVHLLAPDVTAGTVLALGGGAGASSPFSGGARAGGGGGGACAGSGGRGGAADVNAPSTLPGDAATPGAAGAIVTTLASPAALL